MRHAILTLLLLGGFAAGPAQAESAPKCGGWVAIASAYSTPQRGSQGGPTYDYYFVLQNLTQRNMRVDVSLSGFRYVTLIAPLLPNLEVPAGGRTNSIRFGHGTNANIGTGSVAFVYDEPALGGRSTLRLTNCRVV